MPRNSNGQYTLPAGNPVVSGEVISTNWANPTMSDIGAELTNSLDRSGRGGMMAPFKNFDGTISAPGITWGNEPTTGFWRNASQDMRVSIGGQARMRWTATGNDIWNGTIWSPIVTNATFDTLVAAKGYAVKAANETITGTWSFDATMNTKAVTLRSGSVLTLIDAAGVKTLTLGSEDAAGWVRHPTSVALQIDGVGPIFSITATGASVAGTLGVSGILSANNALNVAGTFSVASTATFKNNAIFESDSTVIGSLFKPLTTPQRWLFGRDPATNNLQAFRYDASGAFVNTPFTLFSTGGAQVEGTFNATGAITLNGTSVALSTTTVTGTNSLAGGGDLSANRSLTLLNDVSTPGDSWYYGTNSSGTKGWHPLSSVVGVPEAPIDGESYARKDASWVSLGSSGSQYVLKTGDTMTGGLSLSYAGPMFVMYDVGGPAEQKRFLITEDSGIVRFKFTDDSWNVDRDFLSVSRVGGSHLPGIVTLTGDASTYLRTPEVHVGPSNYYQPVVGATRYLGVTGEAGNAAEMGVFANDGTNNPRAALYATPTQLGIDWNAASGVISFDFRRAGTNICGYDQNGFNITGGRWLALVNNDASAYATLRASGTQLQYDAKTEHKWFVDSVPSMGLTGGEFSLYGGKYLQLYNAADSKVAQILCLNTTGYFVGSIDNWMFQIGGQNRFNFTASTFDTYLGGTHNFHGPGDGQTSVREMGGTNGFTIDQLSGQPIRFALGGVEKGRFGSTGLILYSGNTLALLNATNSANVTLKAGNTSGETIVDGKGALMHHSSATYLNGSMTFQTADPAASGLPAGSVVFVYE